ncbi:hypothetical protein ScPMuIL_007018, partial [Solemya velum]
VCHVATLNLKINRFRTSQSIQQQTSIRGVARGILCLMCRQNGAWTVRRHATPPPPENILKSRLPFLHSGTILEGKHWFDWRFRPLYVSNLSM